MSRETPPIPVHPAGEQPPIEQDAALSPATLDTWAGPVRVEWDSTAPLTPYGQLPFFIEYLKVAGLFGALVADCPLAYTSPNAPEKRDVLGTTMLSVLAGHKRYAHITALRNDGVLPELLGMKKIVSEDAVRRRLTPAAGQSIGMALHELATNAAKYGALSNREGRKHISWQVTTAKKPTFLMSWLEQGGPKVTPPSHKGFGQMVEAAVDGTVESDYRESGLSWKLNASVADMLEGGRVDPSRSNASR